MENSSGVQIILVELKNKEKKFRKKTKLPYERTHRFPIE